MLLVIEPERFISKGKKLGFLFGSGGFHTLKLKCSTLNMPSNLNPVLAAFSGGTETDFAKRILELEAKCEELAGEKINLEAEGNDLKERQEKMKDKCVKQKEKRADLEERLYLEKNKGREEEERMSKRFRELEVGRRKLEVDLKAAAREKADEAAVRLRASEAEARVRCLESLLEQKRDTIAMLLGKIEALEKEEKVRISQLLDLKSLLEQKAAANLNLDLSDLSVVCTASASNDNQVCKIVGNGDLQSSGQKSSDGSHNEPQTDMCTDSASKVEVKKVMENGNSQSSGQKSVDISQNEPQKESIDQGALQFKGPNGQVQFKGNDVSFGQKSAGSENFLINGGSNEEHDGDGVIRKCTTKELVNLSHERTLVVASQSTNRKGEICVVPQRRKVEALGCSLEEQIGTKQCKSNHHLDRKLTWESAQKMFNAFVNNDELCMRSVCVLYRKHKSLGQWKNCSSSHNRGFKPAYETKGVALGELLTSGDPEGRLKKSVAEFERAKPSGQDDCRVIARHHHLELFAIYKNNLDAHYKPDETA